MASRRFGGRRGAPRGVTLVELMTTLTVLGILLAVGVPSLARLMVSNRISATTHELVGALQFARSEAVRRGQGVTLRAADTTGLDYAAGWSVITDADEDGAPASPATPADGTALRVQGATAGATSVRRVERSEPPAPFTYREASAGDLGHVAFNSRGGTTAGAAAYFRVCDTGQRTVGGRIVQVSPVGRIAQERTPVACAATP